MVFGPKREQTVKAESQGRDHLTPTTTKKEKAINYVRLYTKVPSASKSLMLLHLKLLIKELILLFDSGVWIICINCWECFFCFLGQMTKYEKMMALPSTWPLLRNGRSTVRSPRLGKKDTSQFFSCSILWMSGIKMSTLPSFDQCRYLTSLWARTWHVKTCCETKDGKSFLELFAEVITAWQCASHSGCMQKRGEWGLIEGSFQEDFKVCSLLSHSWSQTADSGLCSSILHRQRLL